MLEEPLGEGLAPPVAIVDRGESEQRSGLEKAHEVWLECSVVPAVGGDEHRSSTIEPVLHRRNLESEQAQVREHVGHVDGGFSHGGVVKVDQRDLSAVHESVVVIDVAMEDAIAPREAFGHVRKELA